MSISYKTLFYKTYKKAHDAAAANFFSGIGHVTIVHLHNGLVFLALFSCLASLRLFLGLGSWLLLHLLSPRVVLGSHTFFLPLYLLSSYIGYVRNESEGEWLPTRRRMGKIYYFNGTPSPGKFKPWHRAWELGRN